MQFKNKQYILILAIVCILITVLVISCYKKEHISYFQNEQIKDIYVTELYACNLKYNHCELTITQIGNTAYFTIIPSKNIDKSLKQYLEGYDLYNEFIK